MSEHDDHLQPFTLSNKGILKLAQTDLRAARQPELLQAIADAAQAAGVEVVNIGTFGVYCQAPFTRFVELFGFTPDPEEGYCRLVALPGPQGHLADHLEIAPPVIWL
jgi:hypothetical protein